MGADAGKSTKAEAGVGTAVEAGAVGGGGAGATVFYGGITDFWAAPDLFGSAGIPEGTDVADARWAELFNRHLADGPEGRGVAVVHYHFKPKPWTCTEATLEEW